MSILRKALLMGIFSVFALSTGAYADHHGGGGMRMGGGHMDGGHWGGGNWGRFDGGRHFEGRHFNDWDWDGGGVYFYGSPYYNWDGGSYYYSDPYYNPYYYDDGGASLYFGF